MKKLEEIKEDLKLAKRVKCASKGVWFDLCDKYGRPLEYEHIESETYGISYIYFKELQKDEDGLNWKTCIIIDSDLSVCDIEYYPSKPSLLDELDIIEPSKPLRYASREVNGMDVIDLAEHWDLSFAEGNILKYLLRHKGEDISDLEKIIDYAGRRIKQLNNK